MCIKKPLLTERLFESESETRSALGELEASTCTGLTGLLAFLHPRVASEEAFWLDQLAILRVEQGQRTGNRVADCYRLSVLASALNERLDVELVDHVHGLERGDDGVLEIDGREVILKGKTVDGHFPGSFGDPDVCDCSLAASGCAFGFGGWHGVGMKSLVISEFRRRTAPEPRAGGLHLRIP